MLILLFLSGFIAGYATPVNAQGIDFKPVQVKSVSIDTPFSFQGSDINHWMMIGKVLREDTEYKEYVLRITGYGGAVLPTMSFINSIKDAQSQGKIIIMDVVGTAYSANALITCFGNGVVLRPGSSLMFHSVSYTQTALFGLIEYQVSGIDAADNTLQKYIFGQCVKTGLLTQADVAYILKDGNVTVSLDDGKLVKAYNMDPDRTVKLLKDIFSLAAIAGISIASLLYFIYLAKKV